MRVCTIVFLPARFGLVISRAACLCSSRTLKRDEMDAFLKVGDCFNSFTELESRLKELQDSCNVQLYRRECKTLVASLQRYPGRAGIAKPELKYYLLYCCVFGGRKYTSKTTGDRLNTK